MPLGSTLRWVSSIAGVRHWKISWRKKGAMLRVCTDSRHAGFLERHGNRGATFAYEPELATARAVSVTMPVRLASWNSSSGLLPIFDMNLPEGVLRAQLSENFSAGGRPSSNFDDIDLLAVVGRAQIGRMRCSAADAEL